MNAHPGFSNAKATDAPQREVLGLHGTLNLAVLVLPGFSHLSLAAYIEPFRIANSLSRSPLFQWKVVSIDGKIVTGASGIPIPADLSCEQLAYAVTEGREFQQLAIFAGEPVDQQLSPQLHVFLRNVARRGIAISAFGTATWILAQAGLLSNTRCTIHWSRLAAFSEIFSKPRIHDSLFVRDGQFSTCAGELAAFDLAMDLIGSHAGGFIAQEVCRHATVEGQRSGSNRQTGPSGLAFAGVSDKLVMALRVMEENVERPHSLEKVAELCGMSRRQLERLFAMHVGSSPLRHYLRIRVEHAKRLIEGTRLPLIDIAVACGFQSSSHFAKCFKLVYGLSPNKCRLKVPSWIGPGIG